MAKHTTTKSIKTGTTAKTNPVKTPAPAKTVPVAAVEFKVKVAAGTKKATKEITPKMLARINAEWQKGTPLVKLAKPLGLTWQQLVGKLVAAGHKSDRKPTFRLSDAALAKAAERWHKGATLAELAKPHKATWQQLAGLLIAKGYRADGTSPKTAKTTKKSA